MARRGPVNADGKPRRPAGYEAGGVFFGLLGIALGNLAVVVTFQKPAHETDSYVAALLAASLSFVIDFMLYDSPMRSRRSECCFWVRA